jgi:arylsulfatase
MFSADETADVGVDEATPVVDGIGEGSHTRFTGRIERVTIEVK